MNPHILHIANTFFIAAALLALPSLAALILFAIFQVKLRIAPARSASPPVKNPDAILMIILGMAKVFGAIVDGVGSAGRKILNIIAIAAAVGLLLAAGLFLTARGMLARQPWARGVAGSIVVLLLLVSLVSLLSRKGGGRLMPGLFVAGSLYALRELWIGYTVL